MAKVAHDLRQYLAAGLLLTEAARAGTADSPVSRLETVHELLVSMRELVAAEFREPERDDGSGPARPVDVVPLVAQCLRVAETTHGCAVHLACPARALACVDRVALSRAVMNVVDNAGRAAGVTGTVDVGVRVRPEGVVITVADDGLGFARIEPRSGHGLAIVDQALRRCGGRLELTSTRGTGTRVRLTVPVRTQEQAG